MPTAPDLPPLAEASDLGSRSVATRDQQEERNDALAGSLLSPDRTDQYGNIMDCPEGTIPMRRVTLEQMTRFETVQDFLRKGPRDAGSPRRKTEPATVPIHTARPRRISTSTTWAAIAFSTCGARQSAPVRNSRSLSTGISVVAAPTSRPLSVDGTSIPDCIVMRSPICSRIGLPINYYATGCYNLTCRSLCPNLHPRCSPPAWPLPRSA